MGQDRFEVIKNLIAFLVLAGLVGVFFCVFNFLL